MALSPEELYLRLGRLVETMPDLPATADLNSEVQLWLGRAHALVKEANAGAGFDAIAMTSAVERLNSAARHSAMQDIRSIVYRAIAYAEIAAPAAAQGAFLPAGSPFDALAAVGKIMKTASNYVRIIDPYLDENILTEFALLAPEGLALQLLSDEATVKPALAPAYRRWAQQYGSRRPVEIRLSPARTLHDRAIEVDGKSIWIVTQSFNALAARSPATISRAAPEVSQLKISHYTGAWASATPI